MNPYHDLFQSRVAAWKKDLNKQLYGRIRIGDKIRQINEQLVTDASQAEQFIRTTAKDEVFFLIFHQSLGNLTGRILREIYSASQKKQNRETMECCEQVLGCMTIMIYISWNMVNMLSNDTL